MTTVENYIHEFDPQSYEKYYFDQDENMGNESSISSHFQDEQEQQFTLDDLEMMVIQCTLDE